MARIIVADDSEDICRLVKRALEKDGHATEEAIKAILDDQRKQVNTQIASYAQIAAMEMIDGEFEKTPKQSIKRYLYH